MSFHGKRHKLIALVLGLALFNIAGAQVADSTTEAQPSCVRIKTVSIAQLPLGFNWLQSEVQALIGQCLTPENLQNLLRQTTNALAARGYLTSRFYVPEQDAGAGDLQLLFIPGRVNDIKVTGGQLNASRVLPLKTGDILNTRATDQATDTLRRLTSLNAKMLVEPAENPGQSNLTIALTPTGRAYHGSLSVGQDDLNRDFVQVTDLPPAAQQLIQLPFQAAVDIDNPLKQGDVFSLNAVVSPGALFKDGGTLSLGGRYSLPMGYNLLGFGGSYTVNHSLQKGYNGNLDYNGKSANMNVDISRVVMRDERHTVNLSQKFNVGLAWSYIDDQEIGVQRKNTYRSVTGITYAYNTPETQFSVGLNNALTYNDFLNLPQTSGWSDVIQPTINYNHNFSQYWQYISILTGQLTVTGPQFQPFVIDNSVIRGLPSSVYFSAPHAAALQNKFLYRYRPAFNPYLTLDGAWFSTWANVPARTILASTLGIQGQFRKLSYDFRVGLPINLSEGTRLSYGLQLAWLF